MSDSVADVKESDSGNFDNAKSTIAYKVFLGIWVWLKSVIVFILSILMIAISATIHIIPLIFTLLHQCVSLVSNVNFPDKPSDIPGADFLEIANTFFPIQELFSCMSLYYTIVFILFFIRVATGISKFGLKWTIEIIKLCLP